MAEGSKIKIGYWKIRGLAQQIRLLLAYSGIPFENVYYELGGPPDFDSSSWLNVKFTLGFEFPNLPYLIDGDFKLTESNAIMRYIADKSKLLGGTPQERARASMLEMKIGEAKNAFTSKCYSANSEELFAKYPDEMAKNFQPFEDILSKHKWIAGDNLTYPDFNLYETLDVHYIKYPELKEKYPNLRKLHKAIEELPAINAFLNSPNFENLPICNKIAKWGSELVSK